MNVNIRNLCHELDKQKKALIDKITRVESRSNFSEIEIKICKNYEIERLATKIFVTMTIDSFKEPLNAIEQKFYRQKIEVIISPNNEEIVQHIIDYSKTLLPTKDNYSEMTLKTAPFNEIVINGLKINNLESNI